MSEIESCITSFVDGRVRLRHPSLKRAENAAVRKLAKDAS